MFNVRQGQENGKWETGEDLVEFLPSQEMRRRESTFVLSSKRQARVGAAWLSAFQNGQPVRGGLTQGLFLYVLLCKGNTMPPHVAGICDALLQSQCCAQDGGCVAAAAAAAAVAAGVVIVGAGSLEVEVAFRNFLASSTAPSRAIFPHRTDSPRSFWLAQ
jgi:hypothetical protein